MKDTVVVNAILNPAGDFAKRLAILNDNTRNRTAREKAPN
jgi:hypothetical protein